VGIQGTKRGWLNVFKFLSLPMQCIATRWSSKCTSIIFHFRTRDNTATDPRYLQLLKVRSTTLIKVFFLHASLFIFCFCWKLCLVKTMSFRYQCCTLISL
jgi:hypothetical protein